MSEQLTAPSPDQVKEMDPDKLLKQYERLIKKIANRYSRTAARYTWIDIEDLQQVAGIALLKAQASYKPVGDATFITYACTIMQREILRALNVRWIPNHGSEYEPVPVSLDSPVSADSDITLGEVTPSTDESLEERMERAEIADQVRSAVRSLPVDQTEVIERLFLNEPTETSSQIAQDKGVSHQTISTRQKKAVRTLRVKLRNLQPDMPNHIGLQTFRNKWISEPELYVINKETQSEEWNNEITKFIKERIKQNEKGI